MEAAVKLKWTPGTPSGPSGQVYYVTSGRYTIAKSVVRGVEQYVLWAGKERHPKDGPGWPTSAPATALANTIEFGGQQ